MREINVVGFTPNSRAAPSVPLIFQPVFCRTTKILRFLLENPQEFGLRFQWDLTNLVKEKHPAVGRLKSARSVSNRACERALRMAEEFAFKQFFWDRGAVHAAQRFVAPPATLMNGAGDKLFPSSGFAQYQDVCITRGRQLDLHRT